MWRRIYRSRQLYLLMALPLFYIIVFKYIPLYGAQIAFKNYIVTQGIWGSEWVGLKHFVRFYHSYEFWMVMRNTLVISFYNLATGFPFPILLALCLNYVKNARFKKTVQTVSYAPYFISVVVIVGIVLEVLNPRHGLLNQILTALGMEPADLMSKPEYFKSIYVWSGVWQNVGFSCIIYLAALTSIDPSLHEAAVVDGAGILQRMRHIDLPGIMPVAVILLILNTGQILDSGFEKILLLQNALNIRTSEVIDTYVYKVGLVSAAPNYSFSSAIGLFKSVIGLLLLIAVNKAAQKTKQASLW